MKNASSAAAIAIVVAAAFACRTEERVGADHHGKKDDPNRCATCHTDEFQRAKHPPHAGARPTTCGACHVQSAWKPWRVDHPWYELTGAHLKAAQDKELAGAEKGVKCFWCHHGDPPVFHGAPKTCVGCHAEDKPMSKFPGHETFPDKCEECHDAEAWSPTTKHVDPVFPAVADAGNEDASADAAVDAAIDASKPRPALTARPIPTLRPTSTATTPPTVPTTPPTAPTTKPTGPDVVTRPSRRR